MIRSLWKGGGAVIKKKFPAKEKVKLAIAGLAEEGSIRPEFCAKSANLAQCSLYLAKSQC